MDAEMHKLLDKVEDLVNFLGIEFASLIVIFIIVLFVVGFWFCRELKDRASKAELHQKLLAELLESSRKDYVEALNKTTTILYDSVKELTVYSRIVNHLTSEGSSTLFRTIS